METLEKASSTVSIQPMLTPKRLTAWSLLAITLILNVALGTLDAQESPPAPQDSPLENATETAQAPSSESDPAPSAASSTAPNSEGGPDWMERVDGFFGKWIVSPLYKVLFFDFWTDYWIPAGAPEDVTCPNDACGHTHRVAEIYPGSTPPVAIPCPDCGTRIPTGAKVPLVVLWLFLGAIFFTVRMGFINIRGFRHAIQVTRGDYDKPGEEGEVSHFQALASALSATVGLGNIAGVAIAVSIGGPGAVFWLIVAGLLGMSTKFSECTLGQLYRKVDPDGTVSGGPMHYLRDGLSEIGLRPLGAVLATIFAVVCMGGSFGGGNVFQVGQSLEMLRSQVTFLDQYPWVYGIILVILVGVVIIGGIRRIASTAEKIVPAMCGLYVLASLYILAVNYSAIVPAMVTIVTSAFSPGAAYGGFVGVMITGIRRAAFSNEAGLGSASIAHAAAKTDEPVSEGIVALLEPFIDTVIVCTMTGLVIVITGVYDKAAHPECVEFIDSGKGAPLTAAAFSTAIDWFPWILTIAVCLFAYSTLISWSYYGERCWSHLFGHKTALIYKLIFLGFVFLGSIVKAQNIIDFADLMILSMAFPNILGVALLSGKIRRALDDYWKRLKSGEIKTAAEWELQEGTES